MFFYLAKIFWFFAQPSGLLLVMMIGGLVLLRAGRDRAGRRLIAASVGLPTAAAAPALAIVQSADADPGNHNLFIAGLNLGTTAPAVFLGDTRLTVVSFSPTVVVAASIAGARFLRFCFLAACRLAPRGARFAGGSVALARRALR